VSARTTGAWEYSRGRARFKWTDPNPARSERAQSPRWVAREAGLSEPTIAGGPRSAGPSRRARHWTPAPPTGAAPTTVPGCAIAGAGCAQRPDRITDPGQPQPRSAAFLRLFGRFVEFCSAEQAIFEAPERCSGNRSSGVCRMLSRPQLMVSDSPAVGGPLGVAVAIFGICHQRPDTSLGGPS
jgi:hypothetical protein